MINFLIFASVGKITIFVIQKFPSKRLPWIGKWFEEGKFLGDLFGCDLCLGVWVYSVLALFFRYNTLSPFDVPILSWILTGVLTSFIVHVFSAGWKALYSTVYVDVRSE